MNPQIEFLNTLIKYTVRNIKNDDSTLDQFFKNQAETLRNKIKNLQK